MACGAEAGGEHECGKGRGRMIVARRVGRGC
jgi:hypothetical protein